MSDLETGAPMPPSSPPKPRSPSVQPPQRPPYSPPILWRTGSTATIVFAGTVSRFFLKAFNRLEVHGLDKFERILEERKDVEGRTRGLITVSNHLSIIDDPLLFGALPFRHFWDPDNMRWSMGSHDLMFGNRFTSFFFTLGQCLPTHRIQHSPYGGLWQPMMTQAVQLLSEQPFAKPEAPTSTITPTSDTAIDLADPFSDPAAPALHPKFSTTGSDTFPAPSYHPSRRHAWLHVFPEGRIHQHPTQTMRYFRWGISRLILESEPCPDVLPVWIEGIQDVYHEKREFPRPVPRAGKTVKVFFGDLVEEGAWDEYRKKWRDLVEEGKRRRRADEHSDAKELDAIEWSELGEVKDDWLRYGDEAVQLRKEVADRVRQELVKMRRARGWPEEDARARLAETWRGGRNGLVDAIDEKELKT